MGLEDLLLFPQKTMTMMKRMSMNGVDLQSSLMGWSDKRPSVVVDVVVAPRHPGIRRPQHAFATVDIRKTIEGCYQRSQRRGYRRYLYRKERKTINPWSILN
jgi:hypothetical protein